MDDLFQSQEESERARLRAAGYFQAAGIGSDGLPLWKTPEGNLLGERKALDRLNREERKP